MIAEISNAGCHRCRKRHLSQREPLSATLSADRLVRVRNMLKLRLIGLSDYAVLDGSQRIGRIRLADEQMPPRLALAHHHPHH
jgi:hypothetical protein